MLEELGRIGQANRLAGLAAPIQTPASSDLCLLYMYTCYLITCCSNLSVSLVFMKPTSTGQLH